MQLSGAGSESADEMKVQENGQAAAGDADDLELPVAN